MLSPFPFGFFESFDKIPPGGEYETLYNPAENTSARGYTNRRPEMMN